MLDTNQLLEYTEPVQADLAAFDRKLSDYLRGDSPLISSIARHLLKSKGKRIRPAFLFLSSRASDSYTEHSVDASLAIELIHTATLLHDDVVDDAELRRGQETVNAKWTNLISVLMGDYLFAKAFRIMVDTGSIELIGAISKATERVSVGELRQIEETGNYALSEDEYLEIIADKTASLFAVSCETGPILSRRPAERDRFALFGESIGTAFQIADDLLDFIGEADKIGKQPGNDVMNGKVTLPLIYSLKQVSEASGREIIKYLKTQDDGESFKTIHRFVTENGGIDYAYRRADELCQQGLESLDRLQQSVYYDRLTEMVRFTTQRAS
ncbi:MAG: polyprenyl synthetase family protein [candidate division Zixibacteria bacterium]|nr:polyprenyl synthetase family protein [candidate division Zixibacteria bacterium]